MGLVVGKCLNCAGKIEFNESMKKGFCMHCGTEFIAEQVINNIVNNTTQNINIANAVIQMGATEQSLLLRAKQFMREHQTSSAKEYANKVLDINPDNQEAKDIVNLSFQYKVNFILHKGGFLSNNKFETHCKGALVGNKTYIDGDLRISEYPDGKIIAFNQLSPDKDVVARFYEPGKYQALFVDVMKYKDKYTIHPVEFEIEGNIGHEIVLQNKGGQLNIIRHNCKDAKILKQLQKQSIVLR